MPSKESAYSVEAEMSVLGAMLLGDNDTVTHGLSLLAAADFYRHTHSVIFRAMGSLNAKGMPVDIITLPDALKAAGEFEGIGIEYLMQLTDIEFTTSHIAYYAGIVKEKSRLRSLAEIASHLFEESRKPEANPDEVLAVAMGKLLGIQSHQRESTSSLDELLRKEISAVIERGQHNASENGIPTGFPSLDYYMGAPGLRRSDLVLLAARPSVGKTALAVQLGINAAKKGHSVLFFSLEMSKEQITQRLLTSESRTDSHAMRSGDLNPSQWDRLHQGVNRLYGCPFWVADASDATPTPAYIRSVCQTIQAKEGLSLVIVDYLQLMASGKKNDENRNAEIGFISRSMKLLAKQLGVPVLALSQLSRDVEKRQDKRPVLSDLRDSGSLEQDADIVAFLHREEYAGNKAETTVTTEVQEAEVIFRKNRMGPTGSVKLLFTPSFTRFDEYSGAME